MSEAEAIKKLRELEKGWPKSLWIFTNGLALYIMRKKDGQKAMAENGVFDGSQIVTSINIESDGGDW